MWYACCMKTNREIVIGSTVAVTLITLLVWLLAGHGIIATTTQVEQARISDKNVATTTQNIVKTAVKKLPKSDTDNVSVVLGNASTRNTNPLKIDFRDKNISWKIASAGASVKKDMQNKIIDLSKKIGTDIYPNYDIYIQIARDYTLTGEGENAYDFYILAVKDSPQKGLAFNNLGDLLARVGAYHTAHTAFAKAVIVEPSVELYWLSYLRFLTAYEKKSPATKGVFTKAMNATNSAPDVRIARANYEQAVGDFASSIADWNIVRTQVGSAQKVAIDKKIASLTAKQQ